MTTARITHTLTHTLTGEPGSVSFLECLAKSSVCTLQGMGHGLAGRLQPSEPRMALSWMADRPFSQVDSLRTLARGGDTGGRMLCRELPVLGLRGPRADSEAGDSEAGDCEAEHRASRSAPA